MSDELTQGTFTCDVCGLDTPHSHEPQVVEIERLVRPRFEKGSPTWKLSRFGKREPGGGYYDGETERLWQEYVSGWFAAKDIYAAAPRDGNEPSSAWLIERRDRSAIEWLICDTAGFDWTADPLKPIRFSRREDANQVASLFEDIDVHITEHQWGM